MRVIAGTARGTPLKSVRGLATRPTTDRVKESLFSMLQPFLAGTRVLDLFAGTGALGIEALSRGAELAVFVDKSAAARRVIAENLAVSRLAPKGRVLGGDFQANLRRLEEAGERFDLFFLDPPYGQSLLQSALSRLGESALLSKGALVVAEHARQEELPESIGNLSMIRQRDYGSTTLTFYRSGGGVAKGGVI